MDNHWTERCVLCDAPLLSFEYDAHLKGCLLIEARRTGKTDAELIAAVHAAHAKVVAATPGTPVPHSGRAGWPNSVFGYHGETDDHGTPLQPVVDGKVRCAICGGNKTLYPDCARCDGTGSV